MWKGTNSTNSRQPGESIPFYVSELKLLSENYDFGLNLDNVIRDSLDFLMIITKNLNRLLAETELIFVGVLKIAFVKERQKMCVMLRKEYLC